MMASGGKAALRTARQVLKFISEGRNFDSIIKNVEVVSASPGKVLCELRLEEQHMNTGATLHGGLTATLVDSISTLAIMTADKPPGVSVNLSVNYLKPARLGEVIHIDAQCLQLGRSLAFASVDVRKKSDGTLLAHGSHTKHLGVGGDGGLRGGGDGGDGGMSTSDTAAKS